MTGQGIRSIIIGFLLAVGGPGAEPLSAADEEPDFREVYDLVKQHAAGITEAELNRAAVQGLLSALGPKVSLVSNAAPATAELPVVTRTESFEDGFAYIRIGQVADGLAAAVRSACGGVAETNKLKGVVLDLRYASGDDFGEVAETADLFISKERPLLDWGQGMVNSKGNRDAYRVPVAVLVNASTAGAPEALAAVLRAAGSGLVLGSKTAGQAMVTREFPLKSGGKLRVAIAPIRLGNSEELAGKGIEPDIKVDVSASDERAYYADAFKLVTPTNVAGLSRGGTNLAARRLRFGEAELVRERREGGELDPDALARRAEPDAPIVYDPALARALDLLKGLYMVRQGPS